MQSLFRSPAVLICLTFEGSEGMETQSEEGRHSSQKDVAKWMHSFTSQISLTLLPRFTYRIVSGISNDRKRIYERACCVVVLFLVVQRFSKENERLLCTAVLAIVDRLQ